MNARPVWGPRRKALHYVQGSSRTTLCGHLWESPAELAEVGKAHRHCRGCSRILEARELPVEAHEPAGGNAAGGDQPVEIRPQAGPQLQAMTCPADIIIYGGEAGGGKSFWLLLEALRGFNNAGFEGALFRREIVQHTRPGGLWREAMQLYPQVGSRPVRSPHLEMHFPAGGMLAFLGLEHEDDVLTHQGAQYCFLGWDELTHFAESQFWYLLSRNRSRCGIRPYIRATCNPDPDSFVATLISWWIDQETGYPIAERSGVIRWFTRLGGVLDWYDTKAEATEAARAYILAAPESGLTLDDAPVIPKSLTFIRARLADNPELTRRDPGYRANIEALLPVDRERLGRGNWKIKPAAGLVFNRAWFAEVVDQFPTDTIWARGWDKAGTQGGGKWTAGVLVGYSPKARMWYVADVVRGQWGKVDREPVIQATARTDGRGCRIAIEQEPGSGGKDSASDSIRMLAGYNVEAVLAAGKGSKVDRWKPGAVQAQARNVSLLAERPGHPWHKEFLDELHSVCGKEGEVCDQADAFAIAFNALAETRRSFYG